ncbi:dipeptidyl peptidase 8-like isoform X2 [Hylobates moloch]|uniref:dipeptidyl peptidase 8-like isoform X2 n=1 Tax=Hylobates moloch TaxID=81572 RepID=UPI0026763F02|nr:dipeptidyl peptidase 8-like isoform X2 [Hylobates moloch]
MVKYTWEPRKFVNLEISKIKRAQQERPVREEEELVVGKAIGDQCNLPGKCNMAAAMETEQLGVEIFETADCEENIESQDRPKLEPFYVERYSWSQLKKLLADTRKYHGYMMAKAPHDFMFVKRNDPDGPHSDRIYYLAMSGENRENTLFYSEIPKTINRAAVLMLSWKPLLDLFQVGLNVVIAMIWCMYSDTAFI